METLPGLEHDNEVSPWDSLLTRTGVETQGVPPEYDSNVQDPLPNVWEGLERLGFEVVHQ